MNKTGKIILIALLLLVVILSGFKYKQFFLDKNFLFTTQVSCDPTTESCFQVVCGDEGCEPSAFMFSDGTPYKYVDLPGYRVPECLEANTCPDFFCPVDDEECVTTYCSEDVIEEGEECIASSPIDMPTVNTEPVMPELEP